jgi:hypothetical protein
MSARGGLPSVPAQGAALGMTGMTRLVNPIFSACFASPWTDDNPLPTTTRSQIMGRMIDADDVENEISEEQREFMIGKKFPTDLIREDEDVQHESTAHPLTAISDG